MGIGQPRMNPPTESNILVVGVGNPSRSDDGAGWAVVQRLRNLAGKGFDLITLSGDMTAVLEAWKCRAAVVIVDAVRSGALPGTLHRIDTRRQPLPPGGLFVSSHGFNLADCLEIGRLMGTLPPQVVVLGIEGANFEYGTGLSPAVEQAVEIATRMVLDEVESLRQSR